MHVSFTCTRAQHTGITFQPTNVIKQAVLLYASSLYILIAKLYAPAVLSRLYAYSCMTRYTLYPDFVLSYRRIIVRTGKIPHQLFQIVWWFSATL